jgi:hypothetical protein
MINSPRFLLLIFILPSFVFAQKSVGVFYAGLRVEEPIVNDKKTDNPSIKIKNMFVKSVNYKRIFDRFLVSVYTLFLGEDKHTVNVK